MTGNRSYADVTMITHESVGDKMAGPGIRVWEIARALGKHGVRVTVATPFPSSRRAENVEIREFSWEDPHSLSSLVERAGVVMAIGPVLARVIHFLGCPISQPTLVDVYYVPEIERILLNLSIGGLDFDPTTIFRDELFAYLRQGDFFVCASEKQFDFWLGGLLAAGRLNSQTLGVNWNVDQLLAQVPLGLPDEVPAAGPPVLKGVVPGIGVHDKVIYWGGGIWDWNDPLALLAALKIVLQRRDDVRIVFGALHHYNHKVVPTMTVAERLMEMVEREQWLNRYVFFHDWVPYDRRVALLLESDIGVSLNIRTIENRYAMRARTLDCLWTSLPCILSRGDDSAQLLQDAGLGQIVEPGDAAGVADAILRILDDTNARQRPSSQAQPFVEQLRWSAVVQPILQFLGDPHLAPDAEEARRQLRYQLPMRQAWASVHQENQVLKAKNAELSIVLERYRQRRSVQWADRAASLWNAVRRR